MQQDEEISVETKVEVECPSFTINNNRIRSRIEHYTETYPATPEGFKAGVTAMREKREIFVKKLWRDWLATMSMRKRLPLKTAAKQKALWTIKRVAQL